MSAAFYFDIDGLYSDGLWHPLKVYYMQSLIYFRHNTTRLVNEAAVIDLSNHIAFPHGKKPNAADLSPQGR